MNFTDRLHQAISNRNSLLCVGLDPDLKRIPECVKSSPNPLLTFCTEIIAATADIAAAYKINFAFFEAEGVKGWEALEKLVGHIPQGTISIADAKRADIGNSSERYAAAILHNLGFDSVTVNPYLGRDSVAPFILAPEKGVFVLALTSNPGSYDFQHLQINARPLYMKVIQEARRWNTRGNVGLVVGATQPNQLESVRNLAPDMPFLMPGIGAQGGSLEDAVKLGTDSSGGLALINASRSIIYKSSGSDFADAARLEAESLNKQMNQFREDKTLRGA